MTWAIELNAGSEYLAVNAPILSGDFAVAFRFVDILQNSASSYYPISTGAWNSLNQLQIYISSGLDAVGFTSDGLNNTTGVKYSYNISSDCSLVYVREGTSRSLYGVDHTNFDAVILIQQSTSVAQQDSIDTSWWIGNRTGFGRGLSAKLQHVRVTDTFPISIADLASELLNLSPDASDRSNTGLQPIVTNIVSGSNATGANMPTDGSVWIDLGGSGTDQAIIPVTAEQLTETQLVEVSELNTINAIVCEQLSQFQLSDLTLDNQISTVVAEQKTECSLTAIATINSLTAVITEQITQSTTANVNDAQLITAVQAQQLTEAIAVNVTANGAQDVNVVISEQITQAQAVSSSELQQLQAVITEQLTQVINADIEQSLALSAVTAEQLTEAITVTVDESSGIFVSVVKTEQLTQAIAANIDVTAIANAVISEQLTQYSTQQIDVDLTVSAVIAEQLTQAELVAIIQGEIATSLNIDIDQVSLEILTPTYSIESLTPIYTIKHLH